MFNNFSIGTRLYTYFAFLLVFLFSIIIVSSIFMSKVNERSSEFANVKLSHIIMTNKIIDNINQNSILNGNKLFYDINSEIDKIEQLHQKVLKIRAENDILIDSLERFIQTDKGRKLMASYRKIYNLYVADAKQFRKMVENKTDHQSLVDFLLNKYRISEQNYKNATFELIDYQNELIRSEALEDVDLVSNLIFYAIIAAIVISIISTIVSIAAKISITKPIKYAVEIAENIAQGNLNMEIEVKSKDETGQLLQSMKTMACNIGKLVSELNSVSDASVEGRLDIRGNTDLFKGEYQNIIKGFNSTLDAVIGPLNVAAEYVDRIAKGDLPPKITDNFKGDFNEIKNNLNQCIEAVNRLVVEANMLSDATLAGNLGTRANPTLHLGEYRKIIEGFNATLDAVIGPLNISAEYFDRIAKGDLPPKITDNFKGDFNEIKNNLNLCIDSVNLLVAETNTLTHATEEGELGTRADTSLLNGDFSKIVEGFNSTLDLVVSPIEEISTVMSVFATGDLTTRIMTKYKGDFAKLQNDVNHFADSLSDLIIKIADSVQNTASAAHQISSTAESLAAASQEQSAQADEVANAVEAMSRTIIENAHSASRTADVATQNSNMAYESGKVVEQTVNKMKEIANVVHNSTITIEQLGDSSKQIGEIISVINDIADQTNLLALNAAIEAARAGEQGRGFAVVADEVRKLAERTTDATKQIALMIKGIQNDTNIAVESMKKGNIEVQAGIELADRAGDSLKLILTSTQEVLNMVHQIAAASNEQSDTSEQISRNVLAISKVTADSTMRVEEVARTSDELAQLTEQLRDLVMTFKVENSHIGFSKTNHLIGSQTAKQLNHSVFNDY